MTERKASPVLAIPRAAPPTTRGYWVIENRFLAGAYPGAIDPIEHAAKLDRLLVAGLRTFVNLMEEDETGHEGLPFPRYEQYFRQVAAQYEHPLEHHRIPIRDLGVPTAATMQKILDTIDDSLAADRPVYVHCWGGIGRTGTVIGCWLIRHGYATPERVFELIERLRWSDPKVRTRISPETDKQMNFVRRWQK